MNPDQSSQFHIRKVAVCGAGVMGAQIAAHCVNAGVSVVLFDLAAKEGDKNSIARRAIAHLQKARPAPLGVPELASLITPANYDDDLHRLGECDLVIEAIAERMDWKQDLYQKLAPAIRSDAIVASNTSGLSITALSQSLPAELRTRFCGVHFFNPPRYMSLVELIPTADTQPQLLDELETFLVSTLGKGVVRAKDTPNFIGNRIGVFSMLSIFAQAAKYGLTYDLVDELTGTRLGRARSGTYRTADVVGLDTLEHVVRTMHDQLPDDPFHAYFQLPAEVQALIEKGALGQKTGAGFFKRDGKAILRLDPARGEYVPADAQVDKAVAAILAEPDPAQRLASLRSSDHPQAQFVWAVLRDVFHYSAVHLADIADAARDVDQALVWGFAHNQGPFEIWQSAGWQQVAQWVADDIAQGKALCNVPLPGWVTQGPVPEAGGVQTASGSWSPASEQFVPRSSLPVYQRQLAPASLFGEGARLQQEIIHETDDIQCWTLPAPHNDVLVASFKSKMHTLGSGVVRGVLEAVDLAEAGYRALVIGHLAEPFSAGADLKGMLPLFEQKGVQGIEAEQKAMQEMVLRVRYAQVPVVAAVSGMALGGGAELALYSARRVASFESYFGLVEAGMGLIPGAGGLVQAARRAAEQRAEYAPEAPLLAFLRKFALAAANAQVSGSALEARKLGFLREGDTIVMNRHELLYVAVSQARALADGGWRPPMPQAFAVGGRDAYATLRGLLHNLLVGGMISEHDYEVGRTLAHVLCAGDLDAGELVSEEWMLAQERKGFLRLLAHPKTQERLMSFVKTGKPVRN